MRYWLALLSMFPVVMAVFSSRAVEQKPTTFVLCKHDKTVRTIHIMPEQRGDKECKVTYSKVGVDEIIGQSRTLDGCKTILKNVQSNLESSNWKCRTVESAAISYGSEVSVQ